MVRQKNPGTGKEAALVECIQDFIGEGGKRLRCIEDVAVFVTGLSRAGFSSDQVFASDIEEVRRCMQRQAARPALAQNFATFGRASFCGSRTWVRTQALTNLDESH